LMEMLKNRPAPWGATVSSDSRSTASCLMEH
jgi:hypothetical protein